jgi:hypothetical protein
VKRVYSILLLGLAMLVPGAAAQAAIGVEGLDLTFTDAGGNAELLAGSHPFAVTNTLALKEKTAPPPLETVPDGALRDLTLKLPQGLVGNPLAVPRCASTDFVRISFQTKLPACSDDSAVGVISVKVYYAPNIENGPIGYASAPVYNLTPAPGVVQQLGFSVEGVPVVITFTVEHRHPYEVVANLRYTAQPLPVFGSRLIIWGNPADPAHDAERGSCINAVEVSLTDEIHTTGGSCPSAAEEQPFVTLPRACKGPLTSTYAINSWEEPDAVASGSFQTHDSSLPPVPKGFEDCESLGFEPSIPRSEPTTKATDSPSGLDFELAIRDEGLVTTGGRAGSDVKKAVVTLPQGVTTNPSVASGLGACTPAQYEREADTTDPAPDGGCPQSSKVGSVEIDSPLVEPTVMGSLYVAKQGDNPFDNLLTLYMVAKNPKLGLIVRAAGKVEPDPVTGQLKTTFDDLPELPFSDFRLHFQGGSRAPLITPGTCATYTTEADLYPYANPAVPVRQTASFELTSAAAGGACPTRPDQQPNAPALMAGTTSPLAGAYSPLVLKVSRSDGSQRFSSIAATLPEGLLGRLAGIPYCPEAGIAQAAARSGEGQGALELAQPSCPAASKLGTVRVGAGAGDPLYVSGSAYLAGPYKGAPLSLAIITPAIAGPFDLGVVAVRTALRVDPQSARITAQSDPIPTILHGLPLDVRSVEVEMDRPGFTLNPTSCEPKAISGQVTSTLLQVTPVSQYFQVDTCGKLKFKPTLKLRLKGATRRSGHPALRAVLTYPKRGSYANIAAARVGLPHSSFLDQGNIKTVCTQPQLMSSSCPKGSIYGRAKAWSPLLDKPLSGPVYLGVGYGHDLPDLVADLDGQIRVLLNGKIDTTPQNGIRNTFEAVPDAPVSKFVLELKGGPKKGLLENSENLCRKKQSARARFDAQSGKSVTLRVPIANSCGSKKRRGAGR